MEFIILTGPPFAGKTRICNEKFSKYHRISHSDLFKSNVHLGLRDVGLSVTQILKKGNSVIIDDSNALHSTRSSYVNIVKKKNENCKIGLLKIYPKHGLQQLVWSKEQWFAKYYKDNDYIRGVARYQDIEKWFSLENTGRVSYSPRKVDDPDGDSNVDFRDEYVLPLTVHSSFKLEVPALLVDYEGMIEGEEEQCTLHPGIHKVLKTWYQSNPGGRIIIIYSHLGQLKTTDGDVLLKSMQNLVRQLEGCPVYLLTIDVSQKERFSSPPDPEFLGFVQSRHSLDLQYKLFQVFPSQLLMTAQCYLYDDSKLHTVPPPWTGKNPPVFEINDFGNPIRSELEKSKWDNPLWHLAELPLMKEKCNSVYLYSSNGTMKMAEHAGLQHIKLSKALGQPTMVQHLVAGVKPVVPDFLSDFQYFEQDQFSPENPRIPQYDHVHSFNDNFISEELNCGRREFLFSVDEETIESYQHLYSKHVTRISESGSNLQRMIENKMEENNLMSSDSLSPSSACQRLNKFYSSSRDLPKWMLHQKDSKSSVESETDKTINKSSSMRGRQLVYVMTVQELVEMASDILKQAGQTDTSKNVVSKPSELEFMETENSAALNSENIIDDVEDKEEVTNITESVDVINPTCTLLNEIFTRNDDPIRKHSPRKKQRNDSYPDPKPGTSRSNSRKMDADSKFRMGKDNKLFDETMEGCKERRKKAVSDYKPDLSFLDDIF